MRTEADRRMNKLLDAKRVASRRYAQFEHQFLNSFTRAELLKFYSYGCYCLNLGDRPLTGILAGYRPQDEIDEYGIRFFNVLEKFSKNIMLKNIKQKND